MSERQRDNHNLEDKQGERFLLGIILILTVVYICFEYNSDSSWDIDSEDIIEIHDDKKDMVSALNSDVDIKGKVSLAPQSSPPPPLSKVEQPLEQITDEIKIVDHDVNDTLRAVDTKAVFSNSTGNLSQIEGRKPLVRNIADDVLPMRSVQHLPEFPGGVIAFMKWLQKNFKYPKTAIENKLQGEIRVEFIINTDGSISDIRIPNGRDTQLEREVERVMKLMPRWKPGQYEGKPCRTLFVIPVVFML